MVGLMWHENGVKGPMQKKKKEENRILGLLLYLIAKVGVS